MKEFLKTHKETATLFLRLVLVAIIMAAAISNYKALVSVDVRAIVAAASSVAVAVLLVLGIYFLKSFLFVIPASLIYIYVGMAFDKQWAVLINFAGIFIEVLCTYWLGRFLGGAYVNRLLQGKKFSEKLETLREKYRTWAMLIMRALPVFPIDFISLFLGAYKEPFLPYLVISLVGIMPRVVLFTLLGDGIYKYIPMKQLVWVIICCLPLLAVYWVVRFLRKRKQ